MGIVCPKEVGRDSRRIDGGNMRIEEFIERTKKELEKRFKDRGKIGIKAMMKNSGVMRTGLYLENLDKKALPVLWLGEEYQRFQEKGGDENALKFCLQCMEENLLSDEDEKAEQLAEKLPEYEKIQHRIIYRLIPKKKNQEFLGTIPYISYLDLAVIFYICESDESDSYYYCLIQSVMLKAWGVTVEELFEKAKKNTPCLFPAKSYQFSDLGLPQSDVPMSILTNKSQIYGAVVILYDGILKKIAEKTGTNLIILPSSVHEVLVLPDSAEMDFENLKEIIQQINSQVLEEQEILSDHPYRFIKETGILESSF